MAEGLEASKPFIKALRDRSRRTSDSGPQARKAHLPLLRRFGRRRRPLPRSSWASAWPRSTSSPASRQRAGRHGRAAPVHAGQLTGQGKPFQGRADEGQNGAHQAQQTEGASASSRSRRASTAAASRSTSANSAPRWTCSRACTRLRAVERGETQIRATTLNMSAGAVNYWCLVK
ncbi:hypothetical protein QJS66_06640 [Kocuria rhizophila]|nr:hypothetical protein QJS66_06640 [Kocuria rhizophila]